MSDAPTELRVFHNRLRRLLNIDKPDLVGAGVIASDDDIGSWQAFRHDPFRFFIACSEDQAARLWRLMEVGRVRPKRVQLSRQRGYRTPASVIRCCRPGRWGNRFRVGVPPGYTAAQAVADHRAWLMRQPALIAQAVQDLRGADLGCFCPLDAPCHVDTLLEVANS